MAVTYSVTLRNSRLAAVTTEVGSNGLLRIYSGTRPAGGGTPTTLLAELPLPATFAPAPSGGVLTGNPISSATAVATGTATWFRITTSGGTYVFDGDAGEAGTELILDNASIVASGTVSVSSLIITGGNA